MKTFADLAAEAAVLRHLGDRADPAAVERNTRERMAMHDAMFGLDTEEGQAYRLRYLGGRPAKPIVDDDGFVVR